MLVIRRLLRWGQAPRTLGNQEDWCRTKASNRIEVSTTGINMQYWKFELNTLCCYVAHFSHRNIRQLISSSLWLPEWRFVTDLTHYRKHIWHSFHLLFTSWYDGEIRKVGLSAQRQEEEGFSFWDDVQEEPGEVAGRERQAECVQTRQHQEGWDDRWWYGHGYRGLQVSRESVVLPTPNIFFSDESS